jgi:hypothetical protein
MTAPFVPFLPTLEQLEAMSPQDLFDHSNRCVDAQAKPSMNGFGNCLYSTKAGLHCAVGWLIPEEFQDAVKTCLGPVSELVDYVERDFEPSCEPDRLRRFANAINRNEILLEAMQGAHDTHSGEDTPEWQQMRLLLLQGIVEKSDLSLTVTE